MARHPCEGMTDVEIDAFEAIVVKQPPCTHFVIIKRLLDRGLIKRGIDKDLRDDLGPYSAPQYFVPMPIHMQWCEWCAENVDDDKPT